MSNLLVLIHNGETKVEYQRNKPLAGLQRRFLEKMDSDMSDGININGESIPNPDKVQRMQHVTNYLVNSFLKDNENTVATCCAYLARNYPELRQIRIDSTTGHDSIDLIFDD